MTHFTHYRFLRNHDKTPAKHRVILRLVKKSGVSEIRTHRLLIAWMHYQLSYGTSNTPNRDLHNYLTILVI